MMTSFRLPEAAIAMGLQVRDVPFVNMCLALNTVALQ